MASGFLQSHRKIVILGSKKRKEVASSARSFYTNIVSSELSNFDFS
jgi:hypothetical protein